MPSPLTFRLAFIYLFAYSCIGFRFAPSNPSFSVSGAAGTFLQNLSTYLSNILDLAPSILFHPHSKNNIYTEILGLIIGALELNRALVGWKAPDAGTIGRASSDSGTMFQDLNEDYYPGDVGFDP